MIGGQTQRDDSEACCGEDLVVGQGELRNDVRRKAQLTGSGCWHASDNRMVPWVARKLCTISGSAYLRIGTGTHMFILSQGIASEGNDGRAPLIADCAVAIRVAVDISIM